ncbi:glycosyltransferase [Apibacter raozihei]|uniref:glycosyltransferase n=1 Tax=Apibacter raozihei TaxID=2500547 RepID=UPI000FE2FBE4|nr:glycosyltransferase [Apibacter raozihei]
MLSIIIINYNTFQLTVECINSIKKSTSTNYEIILIDNASKEKDPKEFLDIFKDIKLIELDQNVGFGRANNIGMKQSAGDYYLLLNSDTIIKDHAIDDCINYMKYHQEIDILGCRSKFENRETQLTAFKYEEEYSLLRSIIYFIKRNTFLRYSNKTKQIWISISTIIKESNKINEIIPILMIKM